MEPKADPLVLNLNYSHRYPKKALFDSFPEEKYFNFPALRERLHTKNKNSSINTNDTCPVTTLHTIHVHSKNLDSIMAGAKVVFSYFDIFPSYTDLIFQH